MKQDENENKQFKVSCIYSKDGSKVSEIIKESLAIYIKSEMAKANG